MRERLFQPAAYRPEIEAFSFGSWQMRDSRRSFLSFAAGILVLATLLAPAASGDIQTPPRATAPGERRLQRRADGPATALPQETAVEQGGRVEIILRAEGQIGRMIYFLIRNPPKHGTLVGPPNQISRNVASIGYVHNPEDDAREDEFTFGAQAVGSPVSAPETVRIRVLPAPPIIEVSPPALDFGAVKAGETARAEFTLENRGGSEASGRVDPPAPWVVDGPSDYRLPRAGSQTFRLIFKPGDEQVFTNEMHFQFEARNGVRLVGTGLLDPAQKAALAAASAAAAARANANAGVVVIPGVPNSGGGAGVGSSGGVAANGATARSAAGTTRPTGVPGGPGVASGGASTRSGSALAPANPPAISGGGEVPGPLFGGDLGLANADLTSVPLNEAAVERVDVRGVAGNTVDLAWRPPVPKPLSYRVEVRYLSIDDDKLRIDWRPYAKTDFHVAPDQVTAHLRGLPQEGFQMMRVVAVDQVGQLAAPSPMITVLMPWPTTWWHITPLKVLSVLLVIAVALVIRRRLENQAILQEIDESRQHSNREAGLAWKS